MTSLDHKAIFFRPEQNGPLLHDGMTDLLQDRSISIASTLEILQSCTKPSILYILWYSGHGPSISKQFHHAIF